MVMPAGDQDYTEHIHLLPSAFIQVGGQFVAELQGVRLVTGTILNKVILKF